MVRTTRTTSNAVDPEGKDRKNPTQLTTAGQTSAGALDPQGPVTREEFQTLMQELTQSRQELTQQIHANTELANQLNEERRK